jgi:hypothetical protein
MNAKVANAQKLFERYCIALDSVLQGSLGVMDQDDAESVLVRIEGPLGKNLLAESFHWHDEHGPIPRVTLTELQEQGQRLQEREKRAFELVTQFRVGVWNVVADFRGKNPDEAVPYTIHEALSSLIDQAVARGEKLSSRMLK